MMYPLLGVLLLATISVRAQIDPCDGCKIINGIGFNPWPGECDCYTHCSFADDGTSSALRMCCSAPLIWSQDLLTCVLPKDTHCLTDPCTIGRRWPVADNCRTFHTCDAEGRTNGAECCPDHFPFWNDFGQLCTAGPCVDPCGLDTLDTTEDYPCDLMQNPGDPSDQTYIQMAYGASGVLEQMVRFCAPGTRFVDFDCGCTLTIIQPAACRRDFELDFNQFPFEDIAPDGGNYIWNMGVPQDAARDKAIFDGAGRLVIPRFANTDFKDNIAIWMNFNGLFNLNAGTNLLSNNDCGKIPSVALTLERVSGAPVIQACLRFVSGGMRCLRVPYLDGDETEVYVQYDGSKFSLVSVNPFHVTHTNHDSLDIVDLIDVVHCAFHIGYGAPDNYFQGTMDWLIIYMCNPGPNFLPAPIPIPGK